MGNKPDTLCWSCKKAYGYCSWSEKYIPVDGWTAIETTVKTETSQMDDVSYIVQACPEYEADDVEEEKND